MLSYRTLLSTMVLAALGAGSAGCGRSSSSEAGLVPSAAPAVIAVASDEEEPSGALVLRDDVLERCPTTAKLRGRVDDEIALDAIRAVGDCMTHGALRSHRVFVRGSDKATRLFDEALSRVGAKGRVERLVSTDEADDHRVEVGLTRHPLPGHKEYLTVAVRKSQVVGFVMGEMLLD